MLLFRPKDPPLKPKNAWIRIFESNMLFASLQPEVIVIVLIVSHLEENELQ